MEFEERQKWLAGLKPGDMVALRDRGLGYQSWTIYKISHITPKRTRFELEGSTMAFDKGGSCKVGGTWGTRFYLNPVTDQVIEDMRRHKAIVTIENVDKEIWPSATTDELERIASLITAVEARAKKK